jgi:hypothetical protein
VTRVYSAVPRATNSDTAGGNFDIAPDGKHFIVVLSASVNSGDPFRRSRQEINVVVNRFVSRLRVPKRQHLVSLSPSRHLATPAGCGKGGKTRRAVANGEWWRMVGEWRLTRTWLALKNVDIAHGHHQGELEPGSVGGEKSLSKGWG